MADEQTKNREAFETMIKVAAHGGAMPLPLEDFFSLARCAPRLGEWYFSIKCSSCRKTTPVFFDFSAGTLGHAFSGPGGVRANCHFCPKTIEAKADAIMTLQWNAD